MKRREFIAAGAALLVWPRRSLAQGRPRRIGFLAEAGDPVRAAWLSGLRERVGPRARTSLSNIVLPRDRLPALAAELVALTPELIIARDRKQP